MEDFDDSPLDILDGDGKGRKPGGSNAGCSVALLLIGGGLFAAVWGASKFMV